MSEQPLSARAIQEALAAPFDPSEIKWKPQATNGNRALAVAYVDARVIEDRLDDVLGVEGWCDRYKPLPEGSVVCRLSICINGVWITKQDVGSPSEQPDEGDRLKAAFSDSLKRVAIKFGLGRYLYRLPHQWVDYDPQKKRFTSTPKLPAWALPAQSGNTGNHQPSPAAEPPAPKVINADQAMELWKLMLANGVTMAALTRVFGVQRLLEIPADRYGEVETAITQEGSPLRPHSGATFAEFLPWYDQYLATPTKNRPVPLAKAGELIRLITTLAQDRCNEKRPVKDWDTKTVQLALETIGKFVWASEENAKKTEDAARTIRT